MNKQKIRGGEVTSELFASSHVREGEHNQYGRVKKEGVSQYTVSIHSSKPSKQGHSISVCLCTFHLLKVSSWMGCGESKIKKIHLTNVEDWDTTFVRHSTLSFFWIG